MMVHRANTSVGTEAAVNRKNAGLKLKALRKAAGLTQKQLADLVGQEYYTFISQVENGSTRVPLDSMKLWAKALGVPSREFAVMLLELYEPVHYKLLFPKGHKDGS